MLQKYCAPGEQGVRFLTLHRSTASPRVGGREGESLPTHCDSPQLLPLCIT